jgi:hypothetical protein
METPRPSTSRRRLLKGAAASALGVGALPNLLLGQKTDSALPVVGEGEFIYECHHDWGLASLPEGHRYGGATHGVAIDRQGFLYVTHHGGPESIFVFDPDGRFVRTLGGKAFSVANPNSKAEQCFGHGIDIREEGGVEFLYLSPNNPGLFFAKMTLEGEIVWKRDRKKIEEECDVLKADLRFNPTNASFRPDGGYYLGDGYGSNFLFEYDKEDRFVRAVGGTGSEDGQFRTPHGQWLDDRDGTPKLVVADRANARLQWFDMEGRHLRTQGGFLFPADIDVRGEMMLVPDLHARITILDKENRAVAQLGDDEAWRAQVLDKEVGMRGKPQLWRPGRFVHPHDACFDAEGNIFCAEWVVGGRLTKLRRIS